MNKSIRSLLFIVLIGGISFSSYGQKRISNNGKILFDAVNEEDVAATSHSFTSALDLSEKTIVFSIPIQSFIFRSSTMQKHFNAENVMNSKEFPKAKFKGTIITDEDLSVAGTYAVTVEGEMTIKGSTNAFTSEGEVVVKDGKIDVSSSFTVNGFDFGIDSKDFGDLVEVTLNASYE